MKKCFLSIIPLIMLVMGCAGNAKSAANTDDNSKASSGGMMTLDQALKEAAVRIDERITAKTKIAPLNFNSPHDKFSGYVLDEVTANLVDSGKLTVVDRKEIDLIRGEFDFQFSGEVGDDSMQQLGRMLGAQSIISGSLTDMGSFYRIVIRVLNVQNASVEVQYRANIISDGITIALLTGGKTASVSNPQRTTATQTQTVKSQDNLIVQSPLPVLQNQQQISEESLIGIWKGSYFNSSGEVALILTVYKEGGRYMAIFDFYNLPGRSNSGEGKYYMDVSYNRGREKFYLKGVTWIERPSNYVFADLEGTITGNVFSGFVSNISTSNRSFRLVRDKT